MRVLIADNDQKRRQFIAQSLLKDGILTETGMNAVDALAKTASSDFEVIILDTVTAEKAAHALLTKLWTRAKYSAVLMLIREIGNADKSEGVGRRRNEFRMNSTGVCKPVAGVHRIRSKKSAWSDIDPDVLRAGPLELHMLHRSVKIGGRLVHFTETEFATLERLMSRPGQVFPRFALVKELLSGDLAAINAIKVHIRNLRDKLDRKSNPSLIRTIHGLGYALSEESAVTEDLWVFCINLWILTKA
jgi:two-component system OmpR family response regulator